MQKFQDYIFSTPSVGLPRPVPNATVLVLNYPAMTVATIYSDNGITTTANPFLSAGDGKIAFYAADGRYSIQVSGQGINGTPTTNDILLEDIPSQSINVKAEPYFAVGDGVADDTVAINAAITAAIALNSSSVLFPNGTYKTTGLSIANYAGQNLAIIGYGARILLGANQVGFAISGSQNVRIEGFSFYSAAASGNSQAGISVTLSSRINVIDNDFRSLFYGIKWISSAIGLATTGTIQIPSLISRNIFKACLVGVVLGGSSSTVAAEYVCMSGNIVNDCTVQGILVQAGNVRITDNTVTGNIIGIEIDGSSYANADHGAVIGNTINHNSTCGLYVHDTSAQYSYLISGNNIWANIYANFGAGNYAHPFGAILKNCASVNFTGNIVARNVVNLGVDVLSSSFISNNNFLTDSTITLFNIYEITAITVANGNRMAPNLFSGTLVAGANNNDYEQTYTVGSGTNPAFLNSWVNFGSGFTNAAYRKDSDGYVHLSGVVSTGVIGNPIFTLPAGFRPAAKFTQATVSNNAIGRVEVLLTGDVNPAVGSNVWFSMDGISFKAEA